MKKLYIASAVFAALNYSLIFTYESTQSARSLFNELRDNIQQLDKDTKMYLLKHKVQYASDLPNDIYFKLEKQLNNIKDIMSAPQGIDVVQWSPFKNNLTKKLDNALLNKKQPDPDGSNWAKITAGYDSPYADQD